MNLACSEGAEKARFPFRKIYFNFFENWQKGG
jgi:hypothetical protein